MPRGQWLLSPSLRLGALVFLLLVTACGEQSGTVSAPADRAPPEPPAPPRPLNLNEAPSLTLTPVNSTIKGSDSLALTVQVNDAEDEATTMQVTWLVNGHVVDLTWPDPDGSAQLTLSGLAGGLHLIRSQVTDSGGASTKADATIHVNRPPTAPVVSITPAPPTSQDLLTAVLQAEATDGDQPDRPLTYRVRWRKDGVLTEYTDWSVPPEATIRGDVWEVQIRAIDSLEEGEPGIASTTIANAPPTVPEVLLNIDSLSLISPLTCVLVQGATDADPDDTVSTVVEWWVDQTQSEVEGFETSVPELAMDAAIAAGSTVSCRIRASDGIDTSIGESAPGTILSADVCGSAWSPCAPEALCTNNDTTTPSCACPTGFEGDGVMCTNVDDCADDPCEHGLCLDGLSAFACLCETGYFGVTCADVCPGGALSPCTGHGICDPTEGACTCEQGYQGEACDTCAEGFTAEGEQCLPTGDCPTCVGAAPPPWSLEDIQPLSSGVGTTYGLDDPFFQGRVVVLALLSAS